MSSPEWVVSDGLAQINIRTPDGEVTEMLMSPAYDRVDFFQPVGAYAIKCALVDGGVQTAFCTEEAAEKIMDATGVGMCLRDNMTETEYEGYQKWSIVQMEAEFGGQGADD